VSNIIRVAVLSDLHPTDGSNGRYGSHLQMNGPESPEQNPVVGLKRLVESEGLKADIVICPGDIGSQGDPKTISYGWTKLNYIKKFIQAKNLVAVPGNHDHDSRSNHNKFDPKYILQELDPPFPLPEYESNTHFWAWHWNIIEEDECRILLFNSSAYHGVNNEFLHGRISTKAIQNIKDKLAGLPEKKLNIFVCHHHPHKQEDIDLEDYEAMDGGQKLISILDNTSNGSWIIIHGHKHYPCISYAQGTSSSPIVFSAGSFSAHLAPSQASKVTNQFHLIEFHLDEFETIGGCVGRFKTYDWSLGNGWEKSGNKGLPANGGFGFRCLIKPLAKEIADSLNESTFMERDEIDLKYPKLKYLSPGDLKSLQDILSLKYQIQTEITDGIIDQIGAMRK